MPACCVSLLAMYTITCVSLLALCGITWHLVHGDDRDTAMAEATSVPSGCFQWESIAKIRLSLVVVVWWVNIVYIFVDVEVFGRICSSGIIII